jgi:hypothetical protein
LKREECISFPGLCDVKIGQVVHRDSLIWVFSTFFFVHFFVSLSFVLWALDVYIST